MGLLPSFPRPRGADDTSARLPQRSSVPYRPMLKNQFVINMIVLMGRCQTVIRCFSGFPAVSLPRPRFDLKIACKALTRNDFSMQSEPRKNFFPEFPVAAGKGRGGATLRSFVRLVPRPPPARASRFPSSAAARAEQPSAPCSCAPATGAGRRAEATFTASRAVLVISPPLATSACLRQPSGEIIIGEM
jgi:hypothetical protein